MRDIPALNPEDVKISQPEATVDREPRELTKRIFQYWRGDLHSHSTESTRWEYPEGIYTEAEMARYYQNLGLEFVALTEHTSKPGEPEKLDRRAPACQSFFAQIERIEKLNRESDNKIAILSGAETNIMFDENGKPTLDLPPEIVKKLDLVIASRHGIAEEKDISAIRTSLLMAANHPDVDIIGHPDRYIRYESGITDGGHPCSEKKYWQTWDEILATMAQNGKVFEINFNSKSLPSPELLKRAAAHGLQFTLDYDAHDFGEWQGQIETGESAKRKWARSQSTPESAATLETYKRTRLTEGPGTMAIMRLAKMIDKLENLGITPERVINSSKERLLRFLTEERGKKTANLSQLTEQRHHA